MMFYKRLEKAINQDLKNDSEIVNYCKKELKKSYSERKAHDLQCICEYLQFKLKINVSFEKYQEMQIKQLLSN